MTKKYYLKNVDCTECAYNIEANVRGLDGVTFVSIDMAAGTMYLDASDTASVLAKIKSIEPAVEIMDADEWIAANKGFKNSMDLVIIIISSILFMFGLLLKGPLSHTPLMIGELTVFFAAYILSGYRVLTRAAMNIRYGRLFDETFLMSVATLGAIAIRAIPEAVGVMLFYKIGEYFEGLSVNRSRASIKALLEIRPDYANLKEGDRITSVAPERVEPGDVIIVKPGEKVPLDGEVLQGTSQVDASALTGESVPRSVRPGGAVLSGMINLSGVVEVRITKPFSESSVSKILDLVENASGKKAETEKFITKFASYYTPAVVFAAFAVAVLPPLLMGGKGFSEWIYRALVLLVISCPCALMISIPLGYFGGVGGASRSGILVKGSNFLDALSKVKTVVFDKTGTLTKGVFRVTRIEPKEGFSAKELLQMAAEAEAQSNHPIALSIKEAYGKTVDLSSILDYEEIAGRGVKAKVRGREVIAGNDNLLHKENIVHDVCDIEGTVIHVAVNREYAGYLVISDELREDALGGIKSLRALGVKKILMLTGDEETVAAGVSRRLGLDEYHAALLPEHKVESIERILKAERQGNRVAFVGDGINDAPVIARADVGVAMGGLGSDAAIETADVVIMTDMPSKVAQAISIGKRTKRIVWENIITALSVKGVFIVLGIVGVATMWEAVFADVGVAVIAVFNATRALGGGKLESF